MLHVLWDSRLEAGVFNGWHKSARVSSTRARGGRDGPVNSWPPPPSGRDRVPRVELFPTRSGSNLRLMGFSCFLHPFTTPKPRWRSARPRAEETQLWSCPLAGPLTSCPRLSGASRGRWHAPCRPAGQGVDGAARGQPKPCGRGTPPATAREGGTTTGRARHRPC